MTEERRKSREIIDILADVVRMTSRECVISVVDYETGVSLETDCPDINYTFGNASYVKERLDELSETSVGSSHKLPMIALFCPFNERRDSPDFHTSAKVRVLIACSTSSAWSNEQRRDFSFRDILRPIYRRFLEALREDGRFDFGYDGHIRHEYSENYSYGRYGAHTGTGDAVSEPIDAINITNLELTVKKLNCRLQ